MQTDPLKRPASQPLGASARSHAVRPVEAISALTRNPLGHTFIAEVAARTGQGRYRFQTRSGPFEALVQVPVEVGEPYLLEVLSTRPEIRLRMVSHLAPPVRFASQEVPDLAAIMRVLIREGRGKPDPSGDPGAWMLTRELGVEDVVSRLRAWLSPPTEAVLARLLAGGSGLTDPEALKRDSPRVHLLSGMAAAVPEGSETATSSLRDLADRMKHQDLGNLRRSVDDAPLRFEFPYVDGGQPQTADVFHFAEEEKGTGEGGPERHRLLLHINLRALGPIQAEITVLERLASISFIVEAERVPLFRNALTRLGSALVEAGFQWNGGAVSALESATLIPSGDGQIVDLLG